MRAAAALADKPGRVRVIDDDERLVALGEVADSLELANVPSIEKTPSVTMSRVRAPELSLSLASSSARSRFA